MNITIMYCQNDQKSTHNFALIMKTIFAHLSQRIMKCAVKTVQIMKKMSNLYYHVNNDKF